MKTFAMELGIVLSVLGAIGLIVYGMFKLTDPGPPATPIFQEGEMVTSVLTGQGGQVIRLYCRAQAQCLYKVRFGGDEYSTTTPFLGGTRPITREPMATVVMYEYELN